MAHDSTRPRLLSDILPRVSRSFYLSLRILPSGVRPSLGLAYLFCRAADTIADTTLLPPDQRLVQLERYRLAFDAADLSFLPELQDQLGERQSNPAEHELLRRLDACFDLLAGLGPDDQERIRELVLTLTQGMRMDLTAFAAQEDEGLAALRSRRDLDQYTYYVAGCVGEFWTKTAVAHCPALGDWDMTAMVEHGVRFGKGLQLTNILRDLAHDLRLGRCYLPREDLDRLGLTPEELLEPANLGRVRPLLNELLDLSLSHYQAGWRYTLAIPRREWRLRLACAWPLLIGGATLARIRASRRLLDPAVRLKIARHQVYAIMLGSFLSVWSNRALQYQYARLRDRHG
ncbi:MAG: squalene/phytoene synthase family protein [Desulfurellaceae bacterium]|nr:squalene/phytoene synthase family protein [Desulfurellaceae bacterium]